MVCYLLTWTYFNDVNGARNILINSQLRRILLLVATRKNERKPRKTKKNMGKKIDGIDLVEMRYQIQVLWGLLNLNKKQTSEILIVVAVMMRKKLQKQSSGGVCSWFCRIWTFLESLQNSQKNTCGRVSFLIKVQVFCEISKNSFCYRTPPVTASVGAEYKVKRISNSEWCECSTKAVVDRWSSK